MAVVSGLRVHSMAESRRSETFEDQHGRAFRATVEVKTGDPAGVLEPDGWVAPNAIKGTWFRNRLTPPAKYRLIIRGQDPRDPHRRTARVFIDYDQWLLDWDEAEAENEKSMTEAIRMDAVKKGLSMSQIEDLVKHPPEEAFKAFPPRASAQWPRQLIVAALRGNRWALGLPHPETGEPMPIPGWATPIIEDWLKRQPMGTRSLKANDRNEYPDEYGPMAEEPFMPVVARDDETPPTDQVPIPTLKAAAPKKSHKKQPLQRTPVGVGT